MDTIEQAAGALAGLDATQICFFEGAGGGSAAFGHDGTALIGGAEGKPGLLIFANGTTKELPTRAEGPVCWTTNGVPLLMSAASNNCALQEVLTGIARRVFMLAEGEQVRRGYGPVVAITQDGNRVAAAVSSSGGARVIAWDSASGEVLGEAAVSATALAFIEDGSMIATGDEEGRIRVYSVPGMVEMSGVSQSVSSRPIRCLALTRDRLVRNESVNQTNAWLVAAGYKGGELVIWDLTTRFPRAYCRGSSWSVASLAFHPDGLMLASGGRPEVRIWDTMTGQLLLRIPAGGGGTEAAAGIRPVARRLRPARLPG